MTLNRNWFVSLVLLSVCFGGSPCVAATDDAKDAAVPAPDKTQSPVAVGHHHQLFIDDFVVDKVESVRRDFHPAVKHPASPVLRGEKPWEQISNDPYVLVFGSAEKDAQTGQLRMWYLGAQSKPDYPVRHQCLATSRDGIHWERPILGLIPDATGSKDNNIVVSGLTHSGYSEGLTPIEDPHPSDPEHRYRSLFAADGVPGGEGGVFAGWSPDGVHWTSSQKPVFPAKEKQAHCIGGIMYDTIKNRWIFMLRPPENYLSRAISFSDDFESWTQPKVIFQADESKREDFYSMTGFCYEGIYLGQVVVMWEEPGRYALEPHLVMSRDGENWSWVERDVAFLPHGPRGSWDEFNTQMAAGEPIRMGDQLYFYHSGRNWPHRSKFGDQSIVPKKPLQLRAAIGLATLRVDGFVSLEDHDGGGSVTTRPLAFDGSKLHVNADCPYGELRVEVLDLDGKPIPGYAAADCRRIAKDTVDVVVSWQGKQGLGELTGKPIRLKFYLNKTKLYSFWIDNT